MMKFVMWFTNDWTERKALFVILAALAAVLVCGILQIITSLLSYALGKVYISVPVEVHQVVFGISVLVLYIIPAGSFGLIAGLWFALLYMLACPVILFIMIVACMAAIRYQLDGELGLAEAGDAVVSSILAMLVGEFPLTVLLIILMVVAGIDTSKPTIAMVDTVAEETWG